MKNKVFLFFLAAFFGAAALCAQTRTAGGKKDEIKIPKEVLLCPVKAEDFEKQLSAMSEWLEGIQLPATGKEFQQNFSKQYQPTTPVNVKQHLYQLQSIAEHPDLEEATKIKREWFQLELFNKTLPLLQSAEILIGVRGLCIESNYEKGCRLWESSAAAVKENLKKYPKKVPKRMRISEEEYEKIVKANQLRRKKAYIAWYKENQKRLAEEKKKAAEKKQKTDRKRSDREKDSQ